MKGGKLVRVLSLAYFPFPVALETEPAWPLGVISTIYDLITTVW